MKARTRMNVIYKTRYGNSAELPDAMFGTVARGLLDELKAEPDTGPDDDHTEVSISNEHWSMSAQVSGLITFDNLYLLEGFPSDLPEQMFLRDVPDDTLTAIWRATASGDAAGLMAFGWLPFEQLAPFAQHYYRTLDNRARPARRSVFWRTNPS
jgi:hypothetical protein